MKDLLKELHERTKLIINEEVDKIIYILYLSFIGHLQVMKDAGISKQNAKELLNVWFDEFSNKVFKDD